MKKFNGCWATFEFLDDFCNAIKELRKEGYDNISTLSPCPRHEIDHALGDPQSRVPFFTLLFGGLGVITAYAMTSWMSVNWPLPVSAKPLISLVPYTIIAFEMMVLLGAYGTMFGVVSLIILHTKKVPFPSDKAFKDYNRFTNDRFGLVIRSDKDMDKIKEIINKYQAEELHVCD